MNNLDQILITSREKENSLYEGYNYDCYSKLRLHMTNFLNKHNIPYISKESWIDNRLEYFKDPDTYINFSMVLAEYTQILRDLYLRAKYGYINLKSELLRKVFLKKYLHKLHLLMRFASNSVAATVPDPCEDFSKYKSTLKELEDASEGLLDFLNHRLSKVA